MVNVYTKNGQFNITESLMEAIKANNPELLVEKKNNKVYNSDISNIHNDSEIDDNALSKIEQSYDNFLKGKIIDGLRKIPNFSGLSEKEKQKYIDEFKKEFSKEEYIQYFADEQINNLAYSKALNSVTDEKWESLSDSKKNKMVKNISDDIRNKLSAYIEDIYLGNLNKFLWKKAKEYEDHEIEKAERQKASDKSERGVDDAQDLILFQQILKNGGDISNGITLEDGTKLSEDEIRNRIALNKDFKDAWDDFIKDEDAKNQVKAEAERNKKSEEELKTQESLITPKTLKDLLNSDILKKEINTTEYAARKLVEVSKYEIGRLLGIFGSTNYNQTSNLPEEPLNNANDNSNINMKKAVGEAAGDVSVANDNNGAKKTNIGKNFLSLASGGFKLSPLFSGSVKDTEKFGMAMKYFKEYTQSNNENSLIDNLMDYLILKHSNVELFNQKLNNEKIIDDSEKEKLGKQLDEISAGFLSNVIYLLEIGNDNTFNEIIRSIKFAPRLKENYYISNESKIHIFNVKEQALVFTDTNSKSLISIFIAIPLLAKTTEFLKQGSKLLRHFGNIKV